MTQFRYYLGNSETLPTEIAKCYKYFSISNYLSLSQHIMTTLLADKQSGTETLFSPFHLFSLLSNREFSDLGLWNSE